MKNVCYGCQHRTTTCHIDCESYNEALARNRAIKEQIEKENEITDALIRMKEQVTKNRGRNTILSTHRR